MTTRIRLFTTDKPRWKGSVSLVPIEDLDCVWCGPTFLSSFIQPALFTFGGYGAAMSYRVRSCTCGALRSVVSMPINPQTLQ